ncbi:hypothetical protein FHR75_000665 [Kineococcus radiotolerans]|uniref:Uncharacterized protein n=1 Tax=Kineococcus radiotolerans TaxID=131568 RepID=A0A7W4TK03_KINRA|nr:hypothetical protein [Kineococcus radiotolerans]MBB2899877.1 hypothetical protein [Kineococcus radiotolerans]
MDRPTATPHGLRTQPLRTEPVHPGHDRHRSPRRRPAVAAGG